MTENNPNENKGSAPERARALSPLILFLLGVCLIQFVALAAVLFGHRQLLDSHSNSPAKPSPATLDSREPYFSGHPGPWGNLEFVRITLEPPEDFIPADANVFGPTHWLFEGYTIATLTEFFGQCGLSAAQLKAVTNPATWSEKDGGVLVAPDDELVLGLAEPARQKIYSVLARSQANTLQLWPFKSRTNSLDAWFGRAGLSAETLALLKKLAYHRGDYLCLSDISVIYPRIAAADERRNLLRWLARTTTLLMKLQVKPDSDVNALADYWAKGHRNKDIQALLDSLTKIPGGMTVDVAHLLPPFVRKRLYTFPEPPADPQSPWPDCNWSAFNFFHDLPDDRFYDFDTCGKELEQNYTKVREATFGDLIVFYRPDGYPIHIVVFIADDVVFTKNGSSTFHPWTLMKWDDLISDYTLDYSPSYIIFHPKQQME